MHFIDSSTITKIKGLIQPFLSFFSYKIHIICLADLSTATCILYNYLQDHVV